MAWVPERGDVVWISLKPQVGREQAERRPAVATNERVGLAVFCPITSVVKGYPFEVPLPADTGAHGVVLADKVRSLDWRGRNAEFHARLPDATTAEILQKLHALLDRM